MECYGMEWKRIECYDMKINKNFPVSLMLPVQGPHFETHWPTVFVSAKALASETQLFIQYKDRKILGGEKRGCFHSPRNIFHIP